MMTEEVLIMILVALSLVIAWLVRRNFGMSEELMAQKNYTSDLFRLLHKDLELVLKRVTELENLPMIKRQLLKVVDNSKSGSGFGGNTSDKPDPINIDWP